MLASSGPRRPSNRYVALVDDDPGKSILRRQYSCGHHASIAPTRPKSSPRSAHTVAGVAQNIHGVYRKQHVEANCRNNTRTPLTTTPPRQQFSRDCEGSRDRTGALVCKAPRRPSAGDWGVPRTASRGLFCFAHGRERFAFGRRRGRTRDFAPLRHLRHPLAPNHCQRDVCVGDAKCEVVRGLRHIRRVCVTRSSRHVGRALFPDWSGGWTKRANKGDIANSFRALRNIGS
jgi:hypothetical protein